MMKQYDSYKDSGVEWIGKIPSHWEVFRIRYNYYLKGRIGWQGLKADEFIEEGPYLITGTDFINGKVNWDTCYHISQERYEEAPEIHVEEGDLLITKDGTVGKTAYIDKVPGPSSLNSHLLIIRPFDDQCNNLFLQYVINSQIFDSFMRIFQTGSIMASISQEKFCDFRLPLPSRDVQKSIILYLDKKCGEIDKAVATQEKRVELLKELRQNIITQAVTRGINPNAPLKNSGVEWIGEVPEHWKVMKMNHALRSIADVNHYMPDSVSEGYPYIMTGDLKEYLSEIDLDSCKQISEKDYKELIVKCKAQKGDVIFARYATIGTVCYVDVDKEFVVSYSCVTIKPNSSILDGLFLFYYLQTHIFSEDISQSINSNTQGNVGIESLSASRLIVPPLSEQQEIVSYIESQTARLDKSIEKAEHQIELLQELKQSIITEVVTGKRKVV